MSDSLVSVVIPTYNREDLILDTVRSILRQSYKSIEVIVVSDGGTDDTGTVLDGIKDERLSYIQTPGNSGLPAVARNIGIKAAKGTFIAFCDDDDLWFDWKLETQMNEIGKDHSLLGVAANTILYPERDLNSYFLINDNHISYHDLLLHKGSPICTSTVLLRKCVLDAIGIFDESLPLKGYEDFDLWLRILKYRDHSIKLLRKALICYRVNNSKLTLSEEFEISNDVKALKHIYLKHLPLSEPRLELLSDSEGYSKVHHVIRVSLKLNYGTLSVWDILKDRKLLFGEKSVIIVKHYLKRIYFYYLSLFDSKSKVAGSL